MRKSRRGRRIGRPKCPTNTDEEDSTSTSMRKNGAVCADCAQREQPCASAADSHTYESSRSLSLSFSLSRCRRTRQPSSSSSPPPSSAGHTEAGGRPGGSSSIRHAREPRTSSSSSPSSPRPAGATDRRQLWRPIDTLTALTAEQIAVPLTAYSPRHCHGANVTRDRGPSPVKHPRRQCGEQHWR